ncbi:MAG: hypothetical protein AAGJ32_05780 [Pseudomonadota bacterium]
MPRRPRLFVIDAYSDPSVLVPRANGEPPAILDTLRHVQEADGFPVLAPAILCTEDGAARARGALLITDDQDGVVIVLPEGLDAAALPSIAAAHAWRMNETARIMLQHGGQPDLPALSLDPRQICERPPFHESQLKGCIVPSEWLLLAVQTGDCL